MLRPERMSRVSVTGSTGVMDDVIETVHELRLWHLSDYDERWEGFEPGDPVEGADEYADTLVTVRSLLNILDVDEEAAGPSEPLPTEDLEADIERVRAEVTGLDDRRDDLRSDLRDVRESIERMAPFVELGIDLELLRDYDSLAVSVGEGQPETVAGAIEEEGIDEYELFSSGEVVAVFARTDEETLQECLVGARFTAVEAPEGEGDPESYLEELRHREASLETEVETVETELRELEVEDGGFLLAAEEHLTIELERREAPLSFATTDNAFVAEGWIPTEHYDEFEQALRGAVGDHVAIDELERAEYDEHGVVRESEPVEDGAGDHGTDHDEATAATDGGAVAAGAASAVEAASPSRDGEDGQDGRDGEDGETEVATDGGSLATMDDDGPPVVLDNALPAKPFELLTNVIGRPLYWEFDPTFILLLTFPIMFGFMIGDVGYGALYALIGLGIMRATGSAGWRALGGIAVWAGVFTMIFGVLYGEIFGLHTISDVVWNGSSPLHKGLQPAEVEYAQLWLVVAILAGIAHVCLGFLLGFIKEASHSIKHAVLEQGSWLSMMIGFWVFIFSEIGHQPGPDAGMKPDFLVGADAALNGHPVPLGFAGFSEMAGFVGLGMLVLGLLMVTRTEPAEIIEAVFLKYFVDGLSYTRITAVLLAKAGMAFVVNLLFFGAYSHHGEYHFLISKGPDAVTEGTVMFPGLLHLGILGILLGIVVLVVGHALVLALGITSAGLQAVRLEYVEFFQKFYEGGGEEYEPFGREREYTTAD